VYAQTVPFNFDVAVLNFVSLLWGFSETLTNILLGLMFYDEPPRCNINLELMEKLAVERLRFLRLVEKTGSLHGGKIWSPVRKEKNKAGFQQCLPRMFL
jgi:hypothetical protein